MWLSTDGIVVGSPNRALFGGGRRGEQAALANWAICSSSRPTEGADSGNRRAKRRLAGGGCSNGPTVVAGPSRPPAARPSTPGCSLCCFALCLRGRGVA
eukprot:CAMPEP_0177478182 /NCGR_PEP_ID=MMETSP0369-20130122/24543_1 /TAXON_ID=447022 ORGANISM="Scrippsiella hangoei-like, Strain SHHI-4" /NCGR_SAMPLE_ID=MMETSP0369 /ASSEMBLY_ACC=CAM_ASM_000364 /LENGTH=98 /DNA_ID=CAMNT_0018953581 /DNA_START=253 /DNA_END=546 /DNA_ORIENTATION=-